MGGENDSASWCPGAQRGSAGLRRNRGGESFAARSSLIADPDDPTGAMDLDGITIFGDPQITITLTPFEDLAANTIPPTAIRFRSSSTVPSPARTSRSSS
jgi:hypothetical protein